MGTRSAPAPGQAALPADDAAALFRRNGTDPASAGRPALHFGDQTWTHAELLAAAERYAALFDDRLPADAPRHVAVLLDNVPEYLFALAGAGLSGATVVGLNHTRRDEHLLRDISHTDCALVITEPRHVELLEPVMASLPPVLIVGESLDEALDAAPARPSDTLDPDVDATWALIFTSGTSSAPKAVICSQRRLLTTGNRMVQLMDLSADDVGYIAMPLFHSNALMVGWMPSLVAGASVALARRFSASGWLPDIRRYGVTYFNYTGKPLSYIVATPAQPDDADNTLRVAFGNEGSPEVVDTFCSRFEVDVIDAFGATEGGLAIGKSEDMPPGSVGVLGLGVKIVDEEGNELPRARFDADGRLANADECVGELVSTAGAGPFEGYYNNDEANARALRNGWYWSGDLGYATEEGWVFFAGRAGDWLRVDGENFPAGPIEDALVHHPDVVLAPVYAVPDVHAGDQIMVTLVLREGATFDPAAFATWLDSLPAIGPKWRPRYLRVAADLPTTGTNKVVKRTLATEKMRRDRIGDDPVWVRERGDDAYRPFTAADESALLDALTAAGRERFWDL